MSDYILFEPSKHPLYEEYNQDYLYIFKENKLMVVKDNEKYHVPRRDTIDGLNIDLINFQCIGAYDKCNCFCGEITDNVDSNSIDFVDLRTYSKHVDEETYLLSSKALLLLNWLKSNQYCGRCGSKMEKKEDGNDRAMVCPNCDNVVWPKTAPAIIVAVTKGDKLLLAHNKQFPEGMYSVLAGFVELGETFEQCVKREVFEETGIKVKNIKYFGSQPWPFPNSMMIGYTAEYLEGEIREDKDEIIHADWFSKEEIPGKYRQSISIGSRLIEWFLKNH
jgi:NAD+ diphosphatase